MESLQKIIKLPVSILVTPETLSRGYKFKLGNDIGKLHFPIIREYKGKIGMMAPHTPPAPYFTGVLDKMDEYGTNKSTYWGDNVEANKDRVVVSRVAAVVITIDKLLDSYDSARKDIRLLEDHFLQWYGDFSEWLELLSGQDLGIAPKDKITSPDELSSNLWSINIGKVWTNAGPDVTNLNINIKSSRHVIDELILAQAIANADIARTVSFEDTLLIDGRRRHNREDFNGSCMYFGQYIEAIARKSIKEYMDSKSTEVAIVDAFLDSKTLNSLLKDCRKFGLNMGMSKAEESNVSKIRNIAAHARTSLTLSYSSDMSRYANKVYFRCENT